MLARIQRNQIHHYVEPISDAQGNPTKQVKDVLQIDVRFPEFPELPTYGLRIDFPITTQKVKDAVMAKAQEVKTQMARDEVIRNKLEGLLEIQVEV